ncbi:hypothetical protein FHR75_001279 [Kineococcus radiotolerans]|uniref:Bifunctional DNA primase/polymerase n=1 Tax=Kineococcus radiotolerans TaxID=131568 RepID=A0A7W4TLG6_KINRA|nr:hypothetical protein [Kineococcus radiotolerans]
MSAETTNVVPLRQSTASEQQAVLVRALELAAGGYSVIPVSDDGTKRPGLPAWRTFMNTPAEEDLVRGWFTPMASGPMTGVAPFGGLGIVCGAVSGNLLMVEAEAAAFTEALALRDLAIASGLGELWDRVCRGWLETSPAGGLHVFLRCTEPVAGNMKLARGEDGRQTLAETRGEGGFVVAAPTPGRFHPSGQPWVRRSGGPGTITTLIPAELEQFLALWRTLDRAPKPHPETPTTTEAVPTDSEQVAFLAGRAWDASGCEDDPGQLSPGDDYERRTDWAELLKPAGWTMVRRAGRTRYWRRPGKDDGVSATTGRAEDRDRLYVFSSSTEFSTETPLTKFAAYALMHHSGDYSAAARQLRADGYGTGRAVRKAASPERNAELDAARRATKTTGGDQGWGEAATAETTTTDDVVAAVTPMVAVDRTAEQARDARARVHAAFYQWMGPGFDMQMLDVVLAVAAVEQLDGDPVWLLVVSGPGNAKTETVQALAGVGAHVTSTIASEGALLSATSRKDTTKNATGGMLRMIGERGVVVVKDVTSILSMNRDLRASVLAALREVYDGRWQRNVGTDGGRTLTWEGRLIVVGAVTTAWDTHHAAVSALGDRFVLVRTDSREGREDAGRQALANVGREVEMRADLQAAAADVLAGLDRSAAVLTETDAGVLLRLADLVTRVRTAVERDGRGDPTEAHMPEMPTRFAKGLGQVLRGARALGIDRDHALAAAVRVARDSVPPLRLELLNALQRQPNSTTTDVMRTLQRPRSTVDRGLRELHLLGLVEFSETNHGWSYRLSRVVAADVLTAMTAVDGSHLAAQVAGNLQQASPSPTSPKPFTRKVSTPGVGVSEMSELVRPVTDFSGDRDDLRHAEDAGDPEDDPAADDDPGAYEPLERS